MAVALAAAGTLTLDSLHGDSQGGRGGSGGSDPGAHRQPGAGAREKLPAGWERKRIEGNGMGRASLAMPAGFRPNRSVRGQLTYKDPGQAPGYEVFIRREADVSGADSLDIAHRQRDRIIGDGSGFHSEDATIQASTLQGHPASELTMTFQRNREGAHGPYHRKKELYYVDGKGAEWWITVNMPADDEGDNLKGDRIFRHVLEHVHLNRF